ncbi:MAG: HEPN domain-containing protein [Lachnospiraceae bacterium]
MPHDTEERNLELIPRVVETRDRRQTRTISFELIAITNRFDNNLSSIKSQFELVEKLKNEGNSQYKDVLRSQIVFLESAFDFYVHEITKYGMVRISQGIWPTTDKYDNFSIRLGDVSEALQHTENEGWFLDIVNDTYAEDTFMSSESVISQLNLIGVSWKDAAKEAFYERGSETPTDDKFKWVLNSLFRRRNKIAHQADCLHETGDKIDIERELVEEYIVNIEKIVKAISQGIEKKNNS